MSANKPELKPCPFCGAKAELEEGNIQWGEWFVACTGPDCTSEMSRTNKKHVIKAWNRRAT